MLVQQQLSNNCEHVCVLMWTLAASSGFQDESTFWQEVSLDILYLASIRQPSHQIHQHWSLAEDVKVVLRQWSFIISKTLKMTDGFIKFAIKWNCSEITIVVKASEGRSMNSKLIIIPWPSVWLSRVRMTAGLISRRCWGFGALWLTPPGPHSLGLQMPCGVQSALQFLLLLH